MQYLSSVAASNTNVKFIAILRFLSAAGNEYACLTGAGAARGYCTADGGTSLTEVGGYLPSDSLVTLVQDVNTGGQVIGNGCSDELSNCADLADYCDNEQYSAQLELDVECRLTCNYCTAEVISYSPPSCGNNNCGALWNQFGSTGTTQTAWDIKEQIVGYCASGNRQTQVASPQQDYPAKDQKSWDTAFKSDLTNAITAITACNGGSSSDNSGTDAGTTISSDNAATTTTTMAPGMADDTMALTPRLCSVVAWSMLAITLVTY